MEPHKFVIKKAPEDFRVTEVRASPGLAADEGDWWYLWLHKRCFTTFEAVSAIAEFFGCPESAVRYAGLKDEDAVTEQSVCLPAETSSLGVDGFNRLHAAGSHERSLRLTPLGRASTPLCIGDLLGNGFHVTLRKLPPDLAEHIANRRHNTLFANYFDFQRFGVPGGPRVAHLIGRALQRGEYGEALTLLATSNSAEAARAATWHGGPEAFFDELDPRTVSLYHNAVSSFAWNEALGQLLAEGAGDDSRVVIRETMGFRFTRDHASLADLMVRQPELAYDKYRPGPGGAIVRSTSSRATVLQTQIEAGPATEDEFHPGYACCHLSLFLPAGAYATTAVAQYVTQQSPARSSIGTGA